MGPTRTWIERCFVLADQGILSALLSSGTLWGVVLTGSAKAENEIVEAICAACAQVRVETGDGHLQARAYAGVLW